MKILRIVLTGEEPPHYTITKAFESKFDKVDTIYWDEFKEIRFLNEVLQARVIAHKYDIIFLQVQTKGIIYPETAKVLSENAEVVFNWTGDVREDISWFETIGESVITLFTNMTDVNKMRGKGFKSDYLQTGYDHIYYYDAGQERKDQLVFCANYYYDMQFPLTSQRANAVQLLQNNFPLNFILYGMNWHKTGINSMGKINNLKEAELYNNSTLSLSISHFNYSKYFSDRLLREMACGCCVLSHKFQDCESLFSDGENIVFWENHTELIEKVKFLLEHPNTARKIGKTAAELVSKTYKWENVIDNLKVLFEKYKK